MFKLRASILALAMVSSIAAVDPVRQAFSSTDDLALRAYEALSSGRSADAVALYSEQIHRHPESYMAHYRRGVTFVRLGKLEAALADLDAAVRLSPAVKTANELGMKAWNSLLPETRALNLVVLVREARASTLRQMNRPAAAIADLDVAIGLDPRRTALWYDRGVLHLMNGNIPAATADFDALLARRENVEWRFARGVSHFLAKNWAGAEEDFTLAVKMAPKKALYALWLAKTQERRGILVEAHPDHATPLQIASAFAPN